MATPITSVSGVGAQTAEILIENGFESAEALAAAKEEDLVKISGFGPAKAQKFIEAAQALVGDNGGALESDESAEQLGATPEEKQGENSAEVDDTAGEPEQDETGDVVKNPCTQKLCKKKKKNKKVKSRKKKKKGSSRKKK